MAVKYKVVTKPVFMSESELQDEAKGGYRLVSHAAKDAEVDYIFEYRGGIRAESSR